MTTVDDDEEIVPELVDREGGATRLDPGALRPDGTKPQEPERHGLDRVRHAVEGAAKEIVSDVKGAIGSEDGASVKDWAHDHLGKEARAEMAEKASHSLHDGAEKAKHALDDAKHALEKRRKEFLEEGGADKAKAEAAHFLEAARDWALENKPYAIGIGAFVFLILVTVVAC